MTVHVLDVVDGELSADFERRTRQLMQQYRIPAGIGTNLRQVTGAPLDPPSEWNGIPLTCQTCEVRREQQGDVTVTCDSGTCVDGHPIIEHRVIEPCFRCGYTFEHVCQTHGVGHGPIPRTVRVSIQAVPARSQWVNEEDPHVYTRFDPSGLAVLFWRERDIQMPLHGWDVENGQFVIVATEASPKARK